ncbi:MAG: hypothetical protein KJT03_12250, partial [Verrucomicrobiae bacterium]|nr:hypothetical protein [Verrucomicrobiae bacterium]
QDTEDDEDVYEISPFQVDGSGDTGYLAGSTLAGTRLNSSLSDVAAAISPFTKEFINDIGADSVEDLLAYSNNSVRLDNTELANDNQVIEFEFQFNVRGLPASRSRNYFVWDVISMDNFNVERVDESRGPNSILFGVGSAGGVVNTSTKQARFSEINELQFMFGSNSQLRGSLDFNRVLIEDKLAIRFNAMWDDDETWRLFEFKDQERYHFTTTWKATDTTVIRGEIEWGEVIDNLGRSYLGDDHVSQWIDAGMPTRNLSTANQAQRNNAWINVINDDVTYFSGNYTGPFYTNVGGNASVLVNDESTVMKDGLLVWEANPGGPDNIRDTDYTVWTVFLEQRIGENLNIEAAFNHLETDFLQYDSGGNSYQLRGDTQDPTLDNSPANDHSGDYFYETNWTLRWRDRESDIFRITASYDLELPDYWGRHRFAAMFETQDTNAARESLFEQFADANGILFRPTPDGAATTNGQNRVWRRHYITPGDIDSYYVGSWREPVSITSDGTTYTNQWFPVNQNVQDDDVGLDSLLISMQNFWFNGKLITTYGYREDEITIDKRSPTTDPDNQRIVVDYDTPPERFEYSGGTTTLGIVLKPTDWLSFLYNDSDNQGLPDVNRLVLPDSTFADPSEGEGKDYGLMLNLLGGKVFVRAARFESSMVGLTAFGNRGNVENPNNRILDTLLAAGLIDEAEREARDVITNTYSFGRDSEGYEFQLTGNITDNWSIRLNYSKTDRVKYNIMPEVLAWYPGQDEFWRSFGDDVYYNRDENGEDELGPYEPPSGFDSIYLESDRIKRYLDNNTAFEGIGDQGSRAETANVFTSYRFTDGPLRGFNIGGGVRYNGPLSVAVDIANESVIWGNSTAIYDFMAGYRTKLNDKMDIRFQLNIRNLFDDDEITVAGLQLDGRLDRIALYNPREFQFRTTLSW